MTLDSCEFPLRENEKKSAKAPLRLFGKASALPTEPSRCIVTKSLKYYLASFRNTPAFNEQIVNRILEDLVAICSPKRMTVRRAFASRGGLSLTVIATHEARGRKR